MYSPAEGVAKSSYENKWQGTLAITEERERAAPVKPTIRFSVALMKIKPLTGVCKNNKTPPERKTCRKTSSQSTESGAGEYKSGRFRSISQNRFNKQ